MALNRLASYWLSAASFSFIAVTTIELSGTRFALLYLVCSPSKVTLTDAFLDLV